MTPYDIIHQTTTTGGRYLAELEEVAEAAVLEYDRADPNWLIARHTRVPDAMRGQGIGEILVARMVQDARALGYRIRPDCSYVKALAARHAEWADVF